MPENYLIHFGNKNSGRYPRGSGENPHQHDGYGKVGRKLRKREINKVINKMDDKFRKEAALAEDEYTTKKYGHVIRDNNYWELTDKQITDMYIHSDVEGTKRLVNSLLNDYGKENVNNIFKMNKNAFDEHGVYLFKKLRDKGLYKNDKTTSDYNKIFNKKNNKKYKNSKQSIGEFTSSLVRETAKYSSK